MSHRTDADDLKRYLEEQERQRRLDHDAAEQAKQAAEQAKQEREQRDAILNLWCEIYQPIDLSELPENLENLPEGLREEVIELRKQLKDFPDYQKQLRRHFWEKWKSEPFDLKGIPNDSFWRELASRMVKFTDSIAETVYIERLRTLASEQVSSAEDGGRIIAIWLLNIAASRDEETLTELLSKPDCYRALVWIRDGVRNRHEIDGRPMFRLEGLAAEILNEKPNEQETQVDEFPVLTIERLRAEVVAVIDEFKSKSDDEFRRSLAIPIRYLALWKSALRLSDHPNDRPPKSPAWAHRNELSDFVDLINEKIPDDITVTNEECIDDLDALMQWIDLAPELNDLRDYVSATEIRTKHSPPGIVLDNRRLVRFLLIHSSIRTVRPPGKDGKPRKNRLLVHLADWVKHQDALKEWDTAENGTSSESEVVERIAAVRRKKQRGK
ncbi:MAG: hypothetical protein H8E66_24240 [Planctomycetes bacterium]|nr:hypothetical protein [Planctomycetota bacterium]